MNKILWLVLVLMVGFLLVIGISKASNQNFCFSQTQDLTNSSRILPPNTITQSITVNESDIWIYTNGGYSPSIQNFDLITGINKTSWISIASIDFPGIYNNGTNLLLTRQDATSQKNIIYIYYFNGSLQNNGTNLGSNYTASYQQGITGNGSNYFVLDDEVTYGKIIVLNKTFGNVSDFRVDFYSQQYNFRGLAWFNESIYIMYPNYNNTGDSKIVEYHQNGTRIQDFIIPYYFFNYSNDIAYFNYSIYSITKNLPLQILKTPFFLVNNTDSSSGGSLASASANGNCTQINLFFDTSGYYNVTLNIQGIVPSTPTSLDCGYKAYNYRYISSSNFSQNCLVSVNSSALTSTIPLIISNIDFNNNNTLNISVQNCQEKAYNFSFYDEGNRTNLTSTLKYNINYLTDIDQRTLYGELDNINSFNICINSSLSNSWVIQNAEFEYVSPGYVTRKYYIFDNHRITNNTENITLFNLLSANSITFQLTAEDNSLTPYVEKYLTLHRWYPELNSYKVVDMAKTDTSGNALLHIKLEDVEYRLGLYERNGNLIYWDNPQSFYCSVLPCTKTLIVSAQSFDISSILGIQYTFTYNKTTKVWTFIYSDPSQKTSVMNLTIYDDSGINTQVACSKATSGYAGVLTCDTSAYTTGTLRGEVYRKASPPIILDQMFVTLAESVFQSTNFGSFIVMFLVIALVCLFVYISPTYAWASTFVVMIIPLYLHIINLEIYSVFVVAGIMVSIVLKRIS